MAQLKAAFEINSLAAATEKFLYVWDVDASSLVDALVETATYKKFCFGSNPSNTKAIKNGAACGIENLYDNSLFTADVYVSNSKDTGYGGTATIKEFDKQKFLGKVKVLTDAVAFSNFQSLIDRVEELLGQ